MIKFPSIPSWGFLQNWRLTEAEIDGFCHFWYNGIVDQHVHVELTALWPVKGKTANPLAEPAGICQPSFDRNLFICCRQKPIMPRIGEAYTFAMRKHGQQLYKVNLP